MRVLAEQVNLLLHKMLIDRWGDFIDTYMCVWGIIMIEMHLCDNKEIAT